MRYKALVNGDNVALVEEGEGWVVEVPGAEVVELDETTYREIKKDRKSYCLDRDTGRLRKLTKKEIDERKKVKPNIVEN